MRVDGSNGIVVVGGYGAVGRTVCAELAGRFPGRVFAAGRNPGRAEAFSRETGGRVLPLRLDLADPDGAAGVLGGARVVVACAETGDAAFAREVLGRGVHYVDVSASHAFLRRVEGLEALARRCGATAVLSVGLVPGLTNLLARHCADVLGEEPRGVDISVLLGLGEAHGEEGIRWVVENLDKRFEAPGVRGSVSSLGDPRTTLFPGGFGGRACYRFDFADQHVLARTLGSGRAATRLCFDSVAATRLLALLKRTGALRVLRYWRTRDALVAFLSRLRFGSDGFAVVAEAEGKGGRRHSCRAWGRGEGRATGVLAALVAGRLNASPPLDHGVFHVEQLFDPLEVFADAEGHGIISFDLGHVP
ncbi:MAG TPA: saccharopine dehydrogenase NADP-binding domain-containing protein [Rubrobacter sp.]|jgi:saccharopine dehydrogenase-like NADP-dependent oxidoreductase|nr:saccharopine dehydrogenase NADP-binding domain-containing protein [Rubrobacter sp.]